MADQQSAKDKDPVGAFREMRDKYLDAWAKAMVETVNTDSYAEATGVMLETYLSAASPFREALEKAMLHGLQQLSMPSRADFCSLAERATHMEMKLDDLDAKLDRVEKLLTKVVTNKAGKQASTAKNRKGAK